MDEFEITRRRAFALAGSVSAAAAFPRVAQAAIAPPQIPQRRRPIILAQAVTGGGGQTSLPVDQMNQVLPGAAHVTSSGVLVISFARKDLANASGYLIGPNGVPFLPNFQIGTLFFFQALNNGQAMVNGAIAVRPDEINPTIDQYIKNGLVWQAFHQHFYDLTPMLYFLHVRGLGDPVGLASSLFTVLQNGTKTAPLDQRAPPGTTTLDLTRLETILNGKASVAPNGVVTVMVRRREQIYLGGIPANPDLNVLTKVQFEQLSDGTVAVSPDFAMTTPEIERLASVMRSNGWDIHCLYNQETGEDPQLFYSHQLKTGSDPYQLASEVRLGLDQTNSDGSPQPLPYDYDPDDDWWPLQLTDSQLQSLDSPD